MLLTFITNDPAVAHAADEAGIDRVMVDLEYIGKAQRQSSRSLFLSNHRVGDVAALRSSVTHSQVMVRVNPIHPGSREDIDQVLQLGADVVMLPYFHSHGEVAEFLRLLDGRAAASLLVETAASLAILPELCRLPQVAEIHLGLNDLSISLRRPSYFDVITDGTVERACEILRASGIPFGFGGLGRLSRRDLPVLPELMLASQIFAGATRGWLGRTFRDVLPLEIREEVSSMRHAIEEFRHSSAERRAVLTAELHRQISVHMSQSSPTATLSHIETAFAPGSGYPITRSPR